MPVKTTLKIVSIDLPMDLAAPKGSAPWARAMRQRMLDMLKDTQTGLGRFRDAARNFQEHLGYQQLDDQYGHPFPSFRAFCTAKTPHGLSYDPQVIDALVQETREITLGEKIAEIQASQKHGANQHSNTEELVNTNSSGQGNTKQYQIARLKRDRPDIADALARGEYPSVRAAAKAAGIVHDPTPLDYLHRYWRQVDPEDRMRFLVEMLTPNERRALQLGFEEEAAHA